MGWFNRQLVVLEMLEVFGMDGVCRIFLYETISEKRFFLLTIMTESQEEHYYWKGAWEKREKNGLSTVLQ